MKKNILVVDDSALMRRVICDIINSDSGFQATDTCWDGLEAYEKLCQKAYDAVVLDVNMPRMNGLELLERLQKENIKSTFEPEQKSGILKADTLMAARVVAVDSATVHTKNSENDFYLNFLIRKSAMQLYILSKKI